MTFIPSTEFLCAKSVNVSEPISVSELSKFFGVNKNRLIKLLCGGRHFDRIPKFSIKHTMKILYSNVEIDIYSYISQVVNPYIYNELNRCHNGRGSTRVMYYIKTYATFDMYSNIIAWLNMRRDLYLSSGVRNKQWMKIKMTLPYSTLR